MSKNSEFLVVLTTGADDQGMRATLAFTSALSSISMGNKTTVFLLGEACCWAFRDGARGIKVNGYPSLEEIMQDFMDERGIIAICSVCYRHCPGVVGSPSHANELLPHVTLAGFPTAIEIASSSGSITF